MPAYKTGCYVCVTVFKRCDTFLSAVKLLTNAHCVEYNKAIESTRVDRSKSKEKKL